MVEGGREGGVVGWDVVVWQSSHTAPYHHSHNHTYLAAGPDDDFSYFCSLHHILGLFKGDVVERWMDDHSLQVGYKYKEDT